MLLLESSTVLDIKALYHNGAGLFFVEYTHTKDYHKSEKFKDEKIDMSESKQKIRIYADTSVFGGVFDEEFRDASRIFFDAVQNAEFHLLTSELVREEIQQAPDKVNDLFEKTLTFAEVVEITPQAIDLQNAYIKEGIVTENYLTDALHVALATASNASLIVSWNFKHIVNFRKIPLYNAVNTLKGYEQIAVYSPLEVIEYED